MKVFAPITVARQIGGDYIFIKVDEGFTEIPKLEAKLKELKSTYVDSSGQQIAMKLSTPNGDAACYCEVGPFEIEVNLSKEDLQKMLDES